MNTLSFLFADYRFEAIGDGALIWPEHSLMVISDLHMGKSERIARRTGQLLPPYDTHDTLTRLQHSLAFHAPATVICLGDSFDDLRAAGELSVSENDAIRAITETRHWIWVEGNHDPMPTQFGGESCAEIRIGGVVFRHIACDTKDIEISGHFHPKTRVRIRNRTVVRPSFLLNDTKLIMPSFGTYTGGLFSNAPPLRKVIGKTGRAILTGETPYMVPINN